MFQSVLKERYAIQKQLGQNTGRRTYLAHDLQTQELVVIKLLLFDADFQWDNLKLFQREAETLQSLSHPSIPRYLEHFELHTPKTQGFALVQSYIEAKSLEEWVESGRTFNEQEIKQLTQALLEILIYLHQQSPPVIHRDIKPSNILLGNRSGNSIGQIYLVDFGSVQTLVAREGSTITIVGTYGYMPPEQFGGRAVPASDLYSLGATLIYLVTGRHPAELPQENLKIKIEPKINFSSSFFNWLNWMTEPDLNHRLASADIALEFLQKRQQRKGITQAVQKPFKSIVTLKKDRNSLKIIIPPLINYLKTGVIVLLLIHPVLFLLIGGFSLTVGAFTLPFPENLAIGVIGIIFLTFSILFLELLSFLPKSAQLRIDHQRISLTYNWVGILRRNMPSSSPRSAISKLELNYERDSNICRDIKIWAGIRSYKLPTEHLSASEVNWIAYELSEWLNLPPVKLNID